MDAAEIDTVLAAAGVIVTAIGTFVVLAARVAHKVKAELAEIKDHAAVARDQVQNTHTTNLREEQDERHAETIGIIKAVAKELEKYRDLGLEVKEKVQAVASEQASQRDDIRQLVATDRDTRLEVRDVDRRLADHIDKSREAMEQAGRADRLAAQALDLVKHITSKEST